MVPLSTIWYFCPREYPPKGGELCRETPPALSHQNKVTSFLGGEGHIDKEKEGTRGFLLGGVPNKGAKKGVHNLGVQLRHYGEERSR
jgi:hypothetical protein